MAIADAGHSLTQVSHPVHFSLSTTATNSFTPTYMFRRKEKKGFYSDPSPSGDGEGMTQSVSDSGPCPRTIGTGQREDTRASSTSFRVHGEGVRITSKRKIISSPARVRRSCRRCRAFYQPPSVQREGRRWQRRTGHMPGGRVRSFQNSSRT